MYFILMLSIIRRARDGVDTNISTTVIYMNIFYINELCVILKEKLYTNLIYLLILSIM